MTAIYLASEGPKLKQEDKHTDGNMIQRCNLICCSLALLFLKRGSGDDETEEAASHESLALSQLKYPLMTPFGPLGTGQYFLLWFTYFL